MRKILLALALTAALLAGSAGMASAAPAAASKTDPVPVLYNLSGGTGAQLGPRLVLRQGAFDPLGNSRLPLPGLGLQTAASVGSGALKGAAATSASNAWTVSSAATGKALIKRQSGRTSAHRLQMERNRKEDPNDQ